MTGSCQLITGSTPWLKVNFSNTVSGCRCVIKYPTTWRSEFRSQLPPKNLHVVISVLWGTETGVSAGVCCSARVTEQMLNYRYNKSPRLKIIRRRTVEQEYRWPLLASVLTQAWVLSHTSTYTTPYLHTEVFCRTKTFYYLISWTFPVTTYSPLLSFCVRQCRCILWGSHTCLRW